MEDEKMEKEDEKMEKEDKIKLHWLELVSLDTQMSKEQILRARDDYAKNNQNSPKSIGDVISYMRSRYKMQSPRSQVVGKQIWLPADCDSDTVLSMIFVESFPVDMVREMVNAPSLIRLLDERKEREHK